MSELPDRFIVVEVEVELSDMWLIQRYDEGCWTQQIWGRYGWHNNEAISEQEATMLYQSECVFVEAPK